MTDIQQARDVLAKWREDTTPLPWEHSNDTEGAVVHRYEARVPEAPQPIEEAAQTWDMNDARLIVGAAGNPELLDAIDGVLAEISGAPIWYRGSAFWKHASRIAAAIIAADERMSA